jgi:hypothetical protein
VTRLLLSRLRNNGSIPTKDKRYFSQKCPDQFWGLPTLGSLTAGLKKVAREAVPHIHPNVITCQDSEMIYTVLDIND